jgi:hypothetical protein
MSESLNSLPPEPSGLPANVTIAPFSAEDDAADQQAARDRAEAFSEPITEWNGHPLSGFSIGRENLWLDLRYAASAPPWHQLLSDPRGEGMRPLFPDAVRLLYILTRTPEECQRARQDLLRFEAASGEWADENIPRHRTVEAIDAILTLYNAAHANTVEVVTEGTGSASVGK